jgi:hypothetical protein
VADRVTLYQHPMTDNSLAPGEIPPPRPRSRRHVMDGPASERAICGYPRVVTDMADWPPGSYSDPFAERCARCDSS